MKTKVAASVAVVCLGFSLAWSCASADNVSVFRLKVGDCISGELDADKVSRVDCGLPHHFETFHVHKAAGSEYPGEDILETMAEKACIGAFKGYVGVPFESSSLAFDYLVPSKWSWVTKKDRDILCFITSVDDEPITGSAKGSGR